MAWDDAYPTAASTLSTMAQWEAFWVGGLGGAAGVIAGNGAELSPSINSGARTVSVGTGAALVRGFYSNNPATYTASVPAQSAADRVDRLALRLDRTAVTAPTWVQPTIIQGTSGSATPPTLQTSTTGSWDLPLCRWTTKADGTLTGLVDERVSLGGSFVLINSGSRPSASPPRLGWETDTGRLMYADGSTWSPVDYDSGWIDLTIIGHWTAGGYKPQIRRSGSVVYVRGSIQRTIDTLQSTVDNSPIAQLTTDFYPAGAHNYTQSTSAAGLVRLQVSYQGALAVTDSNADIPVGRVIYLDTTYMYQ
jgi:hypothetical protein